ncbi:MAG TPA: serine/threonine-protein kinase [Xanthomonadaceae bacterium]|jgi:non-specific serine/threonine protein kinase/serine/threonine-protein kinase
MPLPSGPFQSGQGPLGPSPSDQRPSDPRISLPEQPTVLDVALATTADGQTLDAGQRVGPYRIERLLGMGGMGAVYLAEQLEPIQRSVALKLIKGQVRGGLAEAYFLVERQALARMDHPAIAKVFDAGTTPQGHLFFAMEWIDGKTLTAYCNEHGLGLSDRLWLFVRVCKGVQHAHQKGVIHRDLKPGNVLVARVDGQPVPKIIDFGVATGTDAEATRRHGSTSVSRSIGTRGYMSPEQSSGHSGEIDVRSDVYALGIMLFELVASRETIQLAQATGMDNLALRDALLASLGRTTPAGATVDPQVARGIAQIPEPLRWLVARAIDPDRKGRYDSAQALADDIGNYLRDLPVVAAPPTRGYRLRCFARRHRVTLVASALVAVALIAGTTAAVVGMLRAKEAARQARIEAAKSEQTTAFLVDVLSGVDPERAKEMDKTLLNLLLAQAADRASRELAGQPQVLATIEDAISLSYNSLGEYDKAIAHSRGAYAAARASLGEDDPHTLLIQQGLAQHLENGGKMKDANAMLARNIELSTRRLGADDQRTLRSQLALVENLNDSGHFDEAEKKLSSVLPAIRRIGDRDIKLLTQALEDQGVVLTYLGRYDEAEPVFRDAIARETRQWGMDNARTLDTLNEFSIMYGSSHRHLEEEAILKRMLPIREKRNGPDSAVTLIVVANLGGALRQQGTPQKLAESGPYYLRAYQGFRRKYGDKYPDSIMATGNYGNYLLNVGDVKQAIAMEQTALANSIEVFGVDDAVTAETQFQLGKALLADKRYDEAEKPLLAAIAQKQKDLGADHWKLGDYMDPLIADYKGWGKAELAAQWEAKRAALKPKPKNAE